METIQQAKDYLKDNWEEGVACPCCKQRVQLYNVPMSSNMAVFLISLVRKYEIVRTPIHYKDCQFTSRNYPYLAYWGLAKTDLSDDPEKKTNGMWMPTERGIRFANGQAVVPKYRRIYNKKAYGVSCETISITQALGKKFNYAKLMGREPMPLDSLFAAEGEQTSLFP